MTGRIRWIGKQPEWVFQPPFNLALLDFKNLRQKIPLRMGLNRRQKDNSADEDKNSTYHQCPSIAVQPPQRFYETG